MKRLLIILISCHTFLNLQSQNWQEFGYGLNFLTKAAFADDETQLLYIGGGFTYADSVLSPGVVAFDGQNYHQLQNGLAYNCMNAGNSYPGIESIFKYNHAIYFLGSYQYVNCQPRTGVALWQNQQWSQLSIPANGSIKAAVEFNGNLIIGGEFSSINGQIANGLAIYDGQSFQPFSLPFDSTSSVSKLWVVDSELYVFGYINLPNDTLPNKPQILKYTNSQWIELASEFNFFNVADILKYQNQLYIAGQFSNWQDQTQSHLVKFDGSNYTNVGGGVLSESDDHSLAYVYDLEIHDNALWVSGVFHKAGGVHANHFAKWDGGQWCSTYDYPAEEVYWLKSFKSNLFMGGRIYKMNSITAHNFLQITTTENLAHCSPLGIDVPDTDNSSFSIYPNPTPGQLTLQLAKGDFNQSQIISITDVMGKEMYNSTITKQETTIELDVPAGIYFLKMSNGHATKVLVE